MEGTHAGAARGGLSHERDPTLEQGQSVRRKEQQRQHVMN